LSTPQTNGQTEATNKVILNELKKKLDRTKGLWVKKTPGILWGYHCILQSTTIETPLRLTYGSDAMIPVELGETSWRRQLFNEARNDKGLKIDLNLIEDA